MQHTALPSNSWRRKAGFLRNTTFRKSSSISWPWLSLLQWGDCRRYIHLVIYTHHFLLFVFLLLVIFEALYPFAKSEVQAQRNLCWNVHRNIDKKTSGLAFDSHENDKITWKIPPFSIIPASNTQYLCCQILHFLPKLRLTSIVLLGII